MSSNSLKTKAIRGTIWTISAYGTSQMLRFGSNLILTRLLVPELFGLMALINTFITGLNLFSDIGIQPSIIRSDRGDDPEFLNTAWTLQVSRGFMLWFGCLIITLPIAKFYNEPRLLWLVPIVGLNNTIIAGFNSTSIASLNRHMEIKKLALLELGTQTILIAVMIVWAWLSPTIWALVGGNLVSIVLKAFWSHRLNSLQPNRFAFDIKAIKEIISFGKWIFVSTAMTYLASYADKMLLGKFFSLEMFGVYIIAFTFADIPKQVSLKIGRTVIYPVISQLIDLPRQTLKTKIYKKRWQLLMLIILILTPLLCFGDFIVLSLYDSRYEQAAWMLPIVALGLWPLLLCTTIDRFLMVIGKPSYLACGNFLKFIYMIVGIPLGFSTMGIFGTIIVIALNDIPYYIAVNYGLWREKLTVIQQDFQATILFVGLISLILTVRYILGFGSPIDIAFKTFI